MALTPSELLEMKLLTKQLLAELRDLSELYQLMHSDLSPAAFAIICEYLHAEHGMDYMEASRLIEMFPEMLSMTDRLRKMPVRGE